MRRSKHSRKKQPCTHIVDSLVRTTKRNHRGTPTERQYSECDGDRWGDCEVIQTFLWLSQLSVPGLTETGDTVANTGYHLIKWENSNDIVFLSSWSVASASSFEQFGVDGRGWFVAVGGGGGCWGLCWEEGLFWEVVILGEVFGEGSKRGESNEKVVVLPVPSKSRSVFIEKLFFLSTWGEMYEKSMCFAAIQ